jgi:hypothetical protein
MMRVVAMGRGLLSVGWICNFFLNNAPLRL